LPGGAAVLDWHVEFHSLSVNLLPLFSCQASVTVGSNGTILGIASRASGLRNPPTLDCEIDPSKGPVIHNSAK
jgi:hypothetical protein